MTTVAGVLLVTAPGAGPRVGAALAAWPEISLEGGDGDSRVAITCEAADGAALEALAERLVAEVPEILGVYPTFVGDDEDEG